MGLQHSRSMRGGSCRGSLSSSHATYSHFLFLLRSSRFPVSSGVKTRLVHLLSGIQSLATDHILALILSAISHSFCGSSTRAALSHEQLTYSHLLASACDFLYFDDRNDDGRYFNHTNGTPNVGAGAVLNKKFRNKKLTEFGDLNSTWALVDIPAGTVRE